jgi:long-chain acyl-CoA synthetase
LLRSFWSLKSSLPVEDQDNEPIAASNPEATALLIYTSGTTGTPKGVMLSFANLLANIEAVTVGAPIYSPDERVLMLLPLHHIFPLLGTLVIPFQIGATVALSPSLGAEDIIATLQKNSNHHPHRRAPALQPDHEIDPG